jgi:hypothetical protein
MIAAISLIRRRQDLSPTQFRRHWLDVHGPLVCRFAGWQSPATALFVVEERWLIPRQ